MSSQKLSCGMLETQPLSEPLEPLPDMQCEDSELSVAGGREESHSDAREFGLHYPCHIYLIRYLFAEALARSPQIGHTPAWAS